MVIAGAPVENRADAQGLPEDVTHHVFRSDPFRGTFIVTVAGRVQMVVARIPTARGGIDPARQPDRDRGRRPLRGHTDAAPLAEILRSAADGEGVIAGGQAERFTVAAIHLLLKE